MKIIVCHPGKQHSFQLATAAQKAGVLLSYITSVYLKKDRGRRFFMIMPKGTYIKKLAQGVAMQSLTIWFFNTMSFELF